MRKVLPFLALAFVAGLSACNSSSNNSTPAPAPSPSPTPTVTPSGPPSAIAPSPAAVTLSLSGSAGPTSVPAVSATQTNVSYSGVLTYATTCWGGKNAFVATPANYSSVNTNGIATITIGPLTGSTVGTCTITWTSPAGTSAQTSVTVTN